MKHRVDYLIIGNCLAGSTLAWELLHRGKSVRVFDKSTDNRASAVASGIFNPITGRYMTKTWKADEVFPFFRKFYSMAEDKLNKKFFYSLPVYRPFNSAEEKEQWKQKSNTGELKDFLLEFHEAPCFDHQVYNAFGGIEIAQSGYLNVTSWLSAVSGFLKGHDVCNEEFFEERELSAGESVQYREFVADKIIFCNGIAALQSKWFDWLPLIPLKGETLEVKVQSPMERIFNRSVYLVPSSEKNLYKVGATYQHTPFSEGNSRTAREELQARLQELIRVPFDVVHQHWGIRPTTPDRRPILGAHPANKNVILFNGLGTKGVSLAPYLSYQLANWLEGKGDLTNEVNINRFKPLYSR